MAHFESPETRLIWEEAFTEAWVAGETYSGCSADMPHDIDSTLILWRTRYRVPWEVIDMAIEIAFTSTAVRKGEAEVARYFCGVVWNNIRTAAALGWDSLLPNRSGR